MDTFRARLYGEQHRVLQEREARLTAEDRQNIAKFEAAGALAHRYGDAQFIVGETRDRILRREKISRVAKLAAAVTTKIVPLVIKETAGRFVPGKPHLSDYKTTWKSKPMLVGKDAGGAELGWTVDMVYSQHGYIGGDSGKWEETGSYRFRKIVVNRYGKADATALTEPAFEFTEHNDMYGNVYPGIADAETGKALEPYTTDWDSAVQLLRALTQAL